MQKLTVKLKNTPRDTSLVPCSVTKPLNKVQRPSVARKVRTVNNPEENQHQLEGGLKAVALAFVVNSDNTPLMPCSAAKARHLLKNKKAKVITVIPFTIKLLWECERGVQPVTLGIDPGYKTIGISAITDTKELIRCEVELRQDISKKITEKRMYRRGRRNKLWYRAPRFNNRGKAWKLPPSIEHRLVSHVVLVNKIKAILPITRTVLEIAAFDMAKMVNPEISGVEYQQGELMGYQVREYLLRKWGRECAYCGKKKVPLQVEHITAKAKGGSNRVSNLTLACDACNKKKGTKSAKAFGFPEIQKKALLPLKSATAMNIVVSRLLPILECETTYGYITKYSRIENNLDKSHSNDGFAIAGGTHQQRTICVNGTQTRRNNRTLQINRKGFAPAIRRRHYAIQPNDTVIFNGKKYVAGGCGSKGAIVVLRTGGKPLSVNTKKVKLYMYGKGITFNNRKGGTPTACAPFLPAVNDGVSRSR